MIQPYASPYLVADPRAFRVESAPTTPPPDTDEDAERDALKDLQDELQELQRKLAADGRFALLLVFQALDAAGKDGTIRRVLREANPTGFQVWSFKRPSEEELAHDFLWRTTLRLPPKGTIGVFNRSYYEEVLVVRVHPGYLGRQKLPGRVATPTFWSERFRSIREHEEHLARSGTVVVKFWLHISREEQARRFLARAEDEAKRWKFSVGDLAESAHWNDYMAAYEEAIRETSRPWAPWYVIPADDKGYLRRATTEVVVGTLRAMDLAFPILDAEETAQLERLREEMRAERQASRASLP